MRALFPTLLIASSLVLGGCGGDGGPASPMPPEPTGPRLSPTAEAYLTEALDLMEEHSVRRLEIDWPSFRETTREEADGAETTADTYDAIRSAVERLGDGHSRFVEPEGAQNASRIAGAIAAVVAPAALSATGPDGARGGRLSSSVGYVSVPAFTPGDEESMTRLATDLQAAIAAADGDGVCAWIVDLRGNGGGNMWPMLAGVGPILGEGDAGFFVDPEGETETYSYGDGASRLRRADGTENVVAEVSGAPHRLAREPDAIAVLTSPGTVSSGEAIAIGFRERPASSSFGQPTGGLSTAVESFPLDDGAVLGLATSTMADRTGRLYGEEVPVDVLVEQTASGDPVLDRAYQEVAAGSSCEGPDALPRADGADLTGSWTGVGNTGGVLLLDLELTEAEREVGGTATLTLGGAVQSCGLTGSRAGADLELRFDCPAGTLAFSGVATDPNTISGVLRESLANVAFGFERP